MWESLEMQRIRQGVYARLADIPRADPWASQRLRSKILGSFAAHCGRTRRGLVPDVPGVKVHIGNIGNTSGGAHSPEACERPGAEG